MKNILIIGATSAISKAVAEEYANQQASLFLVGRNKEQLSELSQHLSVIGATAVDTSCLDIVDLDKHQDMLADAQTSLGEIDVIFIAPGVLPVGSSIEDNLKDFHVNATCTIALAEASGDLLSKQGKGALAVISSVAGDRGRQSNYWYGTAKGAVSIFMQGLRNKLFKSGVSVTTIKPGFISTPMTSEFDKGALWATPKQIAPVIVNAITQGKSQAYVPSFWWLIMFIIRNIPEAIFKRLSL